MKHFTMTLATIAGLSSQAMSAPPTSTKVEGIQCNQPGDLAENIKNVTRSKCQDFIGQSIVAASLTGDTFVGHSRSVSSKEGSMKEEDIYKLDKNQWNTLLKWFGDDFRARLGNKALNVLKGTEKGGAEIGKDSYAQKFVLVSENGNKCRYRISKAMTSDERACVTFDFVEKKVTKK